MILEVEEEFETVRTIIKNRSSVSRFGDGELRVAIGSSCKVQERDHKLAKKLKFILQCDEKNLLVCIPRIAGRSDLWRSNYKKANFWSRFERPIFKNLLKPKKKYYSSFITRVDNAPHIDCEAFWNLWKEVWKGRDVVLLRGNRRFRENKELMSTAKSFEIIDGVGLPTSSGQIYDVILNRLLKVSKDKLILLCLGPAATALAYDLHKVGYQAIDIGALEMFYRRGKFKKTELISKELINQYKILGDTTKGYGGSGYKWSSTVLYLADIFGVKNILDYGSGQGTLKKTLMAEKAKDRILNIFEYDPAAKDNRSKKPDHPYEMITCTDVLEHIEPERLDNVLDHLNYLVSKIGFFVIALNSANKSLPDGRNTHFIVKPAEWWIERIKSDRKWNYVERFPTYRNGKDLAILVRNQ